MPKEEAVALKIGVVGTGKMGRDHIERLATGVANAQVVAVSDVDAEQAKRVAEAVGAPRVHGDGHDLVADDEVRAVLVASPGPTHAEYVLACVAAGKPVLCEKPLAPTTDACLRVVEAEAAGSRRLVQVGFMRRYDDGYRAVKQALDAGAVGQPLLVHCVHRNPSVATLGAGFTSDMLLTDSVVHEVDVVRWLLGREIAAVSVLAPHPSPRALEGLQDPQFVLLEAEGGVLVDVEVFVNCQYGYDIRCEVVGESGTVSLPGPSGVGLRQEGRDATPVAADSRVRFAQAYHTELQEWVDGVLRGTVGGPSAWDGYATTAVTERGVEALEGGRRVVVDLAERPALYA
jgi:myo-inositol 2-dehydrogenase / D-chiro-inositol 1-dehydrogenase